MVHYITQRAFFGNGLAGSVFSDVVRIALYGLVLMRVYHILPCNKAGQQYPRKKYMIFTRSQINNGVFYSPNKSNQ